MCLEDALVILAGVGAALVGVVDEAGSRASAAQRHVERLDDQVPVVDGADRPADDEAGVEVDHRRDDV